jgi:catecholate siderophore receptor
MTKLPRLAFAASAAVCAFVWAAPVLAEEAGEAPAIIVYGRPDGYDIEQTPTATKTQTPLVDVPQAVTVISREQLDDQGLESLGEALRFVPGVVLGQGEGHRDQVTLRGQNSTADFFVDGIRDDAQYYRPLYNVERVEVLKGANALIFGRGGGGGVINRVSKAPEFGSAKATVAGGIDSFGVGGCDRPAAQRHLRGLQQPPPGLRRPLHRRDPDARRAFGRGDHAVADLRICRGPPSD